MKFADGSKTFWGLALRSTDQTVGANRPTLVAALEIVIVSSALATYAFYSGNELFFSYLTAIAILVLGPLSLQKTDWSTEIGLKYYDCIERTVHTVNAWQETSAHSQITKEIRLFSGFAFFLIVVPIWMGLIRPASVVRAWISGHFWDSVFAIPSNWYRTVLVLDVLYPPESVPGVEEHRKTALYRCRAHFWNAFETLSREQANRSIIFKIAYISAWLLQWAILFLPGAALRLGVKSTVLIWAPITALIWWRMPTRGDLSDKVDYILQDEREKFYRWIVAPFHLMLSFALPVGLFTYQLYTLDFLPSRTSMWAAAALGFVKWSTGFNVITGKLETIEIWGLCSVMNAVITFILFHIARKEARREHRHLLPLPTSNLRISTLMLARNLVSLFLITKPLHDVLALLMARG